MQLRPHNPQGDVFARWLNRQPRSSRRGTNGSTVAVDSAPKDTASLAEHFIALPLRDLRTGWPACVIDAMASGATLGAMARALTVVSRRLYGLRVDERTGQVIDVPIGAVLQAAAHPLPLGEGMVRAPGGAGVRVAPLKPVAPKPVKRSRGPTLTAETLAHVRAALQRLESQASIARRFSVSQATISRVATGKRHGGSK